MKIKLFFIFTFILLFNFSIFSQAKDDVVTDPRDIVIKPKAINGLLLFKVKYRSRDFKLLLDAAFKNGTADKKFRTQLNLQNGVSGYLTWFQSVSGSNTGFRYQEFLIATIRNIETGQVFKINLHPVKNRAFIPNVTVGRYKFEKLELSILLSFGTYSGVQYYRSYLNIESYLPEFTINSNTAYVYGLVDLRKADIKQSYDEKVMAKLDKYISNLKKFKKFENIKVIGLKNENASSK